jgi:hypothetical protein
MPESWFPDSLQFSTIEVRQTEVDGNVRYYPIIHGLEKVSINERFDDLPTMDPISNPHIGILVTEYDYQVSHRNEYSCLGLNHFQFEFILKDPKWHAALIAILGIEIDWWRRLNCPVNDLESVRDALNKEVSANFKTWCLRMAGALGSYPQTKQTIDKFAATGGEKVGCMFYIHLGDAGRALAIQEDRINLIICERLLWQAIYIFPSVVSQLKLPYKDGFHAWVSSQIESRLIDAACIFDTRGGRKRQEGWKTLIKQLKDGAKTAEDGAGFPSDGPAEFRRALHHQRMIVAAWTILSSELPRNEFQKVPQFKNNPWKDYLDALKLVAKRSAGKIELSTGEVVYQLLTYIDPSNPSEVMVHSRPESTTFKREVVYRTPYEKKITYRGKHPRQNP